MKESRAGKSRRPVALLNVVGLTAELLANAPRLQALADRGAMATLAPPLPAVTSTAQASMVTGKPPSGHGIVANGWYFRSLAEVWFWRQSHHLIDTRETLWRAAREARPGARLAKLFWWFNMYAPVDVAVTVRPHYPADGRKIPGIYTEPPELTEELEERLGPFPLFRFWGPAADITSSRWIAKSAEFVLERFSPDLLAVYLPHLDYDLQRFGPRDPRIADQVRAIDALAGSLIDALEDKGACVIVVSEYGIEPVERAVYPNRALRRRGFVRVRRSRYTGDLLDAGASRAFCVCDHQVGHVYVRDRSDIAAVRAELERLEGVGAVLAGEDIAKAGLDHPRSGELVVLAERGCWLAYPYWIEGDRPPDFARTVDIHRKPGYDPLELWLEPGLRTRVRLVRRLAQKALGMRYLMDVIATDDRLIRGSHGLLPAREELGPLVITNRGSLLDADRLPMTAVKSIVLEALSGEA